jgi:hypothetical protein
MTFLETKTLQNMDGKIYALKHYTVTENAMNKAVRVENVKKKLGLCKDFH